LGLLDPLYKAVAWIIIQLHAGLTSIGLDPDGGVSWGFSIVILVILVRILLIPLFVKQIHSMRTMQTLQPQIKELQKRYKDDRQRQSQEMMKLYQEHGTTPLSGCLPIILQAPFFFSLFTVLNAIANDEVKYGFTRDLVDSASQALIFGAPIASSFFDPAGGPETTVKIVCAVLVVLMSISTFITQKQVMVKNTVVTGDNPYAAQQKILLYVFPFLFLIFGVNFPIGVLIYWLTTNLFSMAQQFYVIHHMPAPGTPAAQAKADRQARKAEKKGSRGVSSDGSVAGEVVSSETADGSTESSETARPKPARRQPVRQSRSKRTGPRKR
jgi:YidC/Oxa1 family membrane protein insertase